jgi:hypothetical protein
MSLLKSLADKRKCGRQEAGLVFAIRAKSYCLRGRSSIGFQMLCFATAATNMCAHKNASAPRKLLFRKIFCCTSTASRIKFAASRFS